MSSPVKISPSDRPPHYPGGDALEHAPHYSATNAFPRRALTASVKNHPEASLQ